MTGKRNYVLTNVLIYSVMHALIDCLCAGILLTVAQRQLIDKSFLVDYFIYYNLLAFGGQVIVGLITDHFRSPQITCLIGSILVVICALVFSSTPFIAIIAAGVGNALFHVGAGSICLNLEPHKSSIPGIFVAPGALGLLIGTLLGKAGKFIAWPFALATVLLSVICLLTKAPDINYTVEQQNKKASSIFALIFTMVFLSISIRSFIGMVIVFPWKANIPLAFALTAAIVLGKGLGGVIGDKLGWRKTAVGALILSIPFLIIGTSIPIAGIIGMFLFNITMPITLIAMYEIIPGKPATAFGLTCLALILGAIPSFTEIKNSANTAFIIIFVILASALCLYLGLKHNLSPDKI